MPAEGPTVRRRRVALELKRARDASGMTQEEVSKHFDWHPAKVNRIENARVPVSARDVRDMLSLCGVHDQERIDRLVTLARQSREKTWYMDYKDVMRPGNYVGLEAEASSVQLWEPLVMPGILQTEEYARAILRSGRIVLSDEEIDRRIELRVARQTALTRDDPLQVMAIIDEPVLHRPVGGVEVMKAQLQKVLDAAKLRNVIVCVLPMSVGEHPLIGGPAAILEFPVALDLDVVYLEGAAGDYYIEQPEDVAAYRREMELLASLARDKDDSARLLEKHIEQLDRA